jgi:hypothetical protein
MSCAKLPELRPGYFMKCVATEGKQVTLFVQKVMVCPFIVNTPGIQEPRYFVIRLQSKTKIAKSFKKA